MAYFSYSFPIMTMQQNIKIDLTDLQTNIHCHTSIQ